MIDLNPKYSNEVNLFLNKLQTNTNLQGNFSNTLNAMINYKPTHLDIVLCKCVDKLNEVEKPIIVSNEFRENSVEVTRPVIINDVDYIVLTYYWEDSAGTDLDTRTFIKIPDRKDSMVGWNKANDDYDYLQWASDNTQSGRESVLITLNNLKRDNIAVDNLVKVSMNAFWYGDRLTGDIRIYVDFYKNGEMEKDEYTYINNGGQKINTYHVNANIRSKEKDLGESVAEVNINIQTKEVTLNKV